MSQFSFGKLHLPSIPEAASSPDPAWIEYPSNAILCALAVFLVFISMRNFLNIAGPVIMSLTRKRGPEQLEHSLKSAHERDLCALIVLPSLIAICDRYLLIHPRFLENFEEWARIPAVAGFLFGYLILRILFRSFTPHQKIRGDSLLVARKLILTFSIVYTFIAAITICLMPVFKLDDTAIKTILTAECAIVYLWYLIKIGQNFRSKCTSISTFLYLCALEILPAAIFICAVVLL